MKKILYAAALLVVLTSLTACIGEDKPPVNSSDIPVSSDTVPTEITTAVPDVTTGPLVTETVPVTTETAEPVVTTDVPVTTAPVVTTVPSAPVTRPTEPPATTEEPPVTTEPAETTAFDFAKSDLSEYIMLGQYLGIEVYVSAPAEVDEEDVEAEISAALETLPEETRIYNRACAMGDKVNISFVGRMNADLFDGGSLSDYTLTLGSGVLIPGFEEKIAGMLPGDILTFTLTFPESYYAELAGKEAQFEVTLNYIYPTLTDAIAVKYFNAASAEAYRKSVRDAFAAEIEAEFTAEKEMSAWTVALANARILQYPESRVNEAFENNKAVYTAFAHLNGMSYEEFFPAFYGLTVADAETIMMESSKNIVAQQLLLYAIARDMGIDVTDERFEEDLKATAAILGLESVEALVEQLGRNKATLKEDKLYSQVITAIVAQAKFVILE